MLWLTRVFDLNDYNGKHLQVTSPFYFDVFDSSAPASVLLSLDEGAGIYRSSSICEAFWVISAHAPAPSITMEELLLRFQQNHPNLDIYWTETSPERKAAAKLVHDGQSTLEQRRDAFRLDDCIVIPVREAVFSYTAQLCKPVEYVALDHSGYQLAVRNRASVCQVVNSHVSQQFKGRYMLFETTEYFQNVFLSGWFRAAGSTKTSFCIGPGNVVQFGACLGQGKDCIDRIRHKKEFQTQASLS